MRKVIGIGETVLDIIFEEERPVAAKPGGSSFNAMITLGRLNVPALFISETGNDKVGDMIISFLQKNNINTNYITRFMDGKSAISLAFLNKLNDADYQFYKDYPKQRLQVDLPKINANDILIFGSYFALNPALRPQVKTLLQFAQNNDAIVYYDPNFRTSHLHELYHLKPTILENFNDATIIRGSDEDFFNIFSTYELKALYPMVCSNNQPLIYTMNSKGVIVKHNNQEHVFPAQQIKTTSTIGAGDNFNAGLSYALFKYNIKKSDLDGLGFEGWQKIIELAVSFASEVCQSYDNYISENFAEQLKL